MLVQAGDFREAGDIYRSLEGYSQAGECYERCNEFEQAGDMRRLAGEWAKAADNFARAAASQGVRRIVYLGGLVPEDGEALSTHLASRVEVEVERQIDLNTKAAVLEYGIDHFVEQCKKRVLRFAGRQTEQSERLGYWMEWDDRNARSTQLRVDRALLGLHASLGKYTEGRIIFDIDGKDTRGALWEAWASLSPGRYARVTASRIVFERSFTIPEAEALPPHERVGRWALGEHEKAPAEPGLRKGR